MFPGLKAIFCKNCCCLSCANEVKKTLIFKSHFNTAFMKNNVTEEIFISLHNVRKNQFVSFTGSLSDLVEAVKCFFSLSDLIASLGCNKENISISQHFFIVVPLFKSSCSGNPYLLVIGFNLQESCF